MNNNDTSKKNFSYDNIRDMLLKNLCVPTKYFEEDISIRRATMRRQEYEEWKLRLMEKQEQKEGWMDRENCEELRQMIDGELNSVAVTNDLEELESMFTHLIRNVHKYCSSNRERIQSEVKA